MHGREGEHVPPRRGAAVEHAPDGVVVARLELAEPARKPGGLDARVAQCAQHAGLLLGQRAVGGHYQCPRVAHVVRLPLKRRRACQAREAFDVEHGRGRRQDAFGQGPAAPELRGLDDVEPARRRPGRVVGRAVAGRHRRDERVDDRGHGPGAVQLLRAAGAVRPADAEHVGVVPDPFEAGDAVPGRGEVPAAGPRGGGAEGEQLPVVLVVVCARRGRWGLGEAEPARVEDADAVRRELQQGGPGDGVLRRGPVAVRRGAVCGGRRVPPAGNPDVEAPPDRARALGRGRVPVEYDVSLVNSCHCFCFCSPSSVQQQHAAQLKSQPQSESPHLVSIIFFFFPVMVQLLILLLTVFAAFFS